jgi:hypothetical protein
MGKSRKKRLENELEPSLGARRRDWGFVEWDSGEAKKKKERIERCPRGGKREVERTKTRRMIHKQVNLCAHVFLYTILYAPTCLLFFSS